MNDERVVEEIVTKFLLNTCRLRPQLTKPVVDAALICALMVTKTPPDDKEEHHIPLTTGSVAEFYIEPMFPHFGDIDMMDHRSTQLAIPQGHRPPTQLPAEFHSFVRVDEIIDSDSPGYVYLELRYLLVECVDDGKYNAVKYSRQNWYLLNYRTFDGPVDIHGPAVVEDRGPSLLSFDYVHCLRCLLYTSDAADE